MKDEQGELRSREVNKDAKTRGLLAPKVGIPMDTAREAAVESGYLPEGADINDLLNAIDREIYGKQVFSRDDMDELIARQMAEEEPQPEPEPEDQEEEEEPEHRAGKGNRRSEILEFVPAFVIDKKKHKNFSRAKHRARAHFLASGDDIDGVHLIFKWRNPDNRNPLHANWKTTEDTGQSLKEFWNTLHRDRGALARWLEIPYFEEIDREAKRLRTTALRKYHQTVRSLQKPGWTYARARKEYRRRFKKSKHKRR